MAFFFWLQPSLTSTVPLRLLDILAERGDTLARDVISDFGDKSVEKSEIEGPGTPPRHKADETRREGELPIRTEAVDIAVAPCRLPR